MTALQVTDLHKAFRRDVFAPLNPVLHGVNFSLTMGSITAFLGGNGAGKTTTLKCVLELLTRDKGDVVFFGNSQLNNAVKKRIGFLPERTYFYEYLTGLEFLQFYGDLSGKFTRAEVKTRATKLMERVGLGHVLNKRLRFYSKGMLQKIGLAQSLIHEPELVILDEPMSGLDPDGRVIVAEIIIETAKRGAAVFFSSHLINDAEKICDRVVMMKDGKTLYEGNTEALLQETQRGFQLRTGRDGQANSRFVETEGELQKQLAAAFSAGLHILEVLPVRMTLEEIFVSRALRGKPE